MNAYSVITDLNIPSSEAILFSKRPCLLKQNLNGKVLNDNTVNLVET